MKVNISIDVEEDLHTNKNIGLIEGMPKLFKILEKHNIKATLFAPALLIKKFPKEFKSMKKRGHEIALHGYAHERFDDLSYEEKEKRIKKSIEIYKRIFNEKPKGFRAPQLSIDDSALFLLKKYRFDYDSSFSPFNLLQLFFFPKRIKVWLKGFFKPLNVFKFHNNLYEVPISSFIMPFTALLLRISNRQFLKLYIKILMLTNKNIVFFAHSWDFIELKDSRIDKKFPYTIFLENLEFMIKYMKKDNHFVKIEDMIKDKS